MLVNVWVFDFALLVNDCGWWFGVCFIDFCLFVCWSDVLFIGYFVLYYLCLLLMLFSVVVFCFGLLLWWLVFRLLWFMCWLLWLFCCILVVCWAVFGLEVCVCGCCLLCLLVALGVVDLIWLHLIAWDGMWIWLLFCLGMLICFVGLFYVLFVWRCDSFVIVCGIIVRWFGCWFIGFDVGVLLMFVLDDGV